MRTANLLPANLLPVLGIAGLISGAAVGAVAPAAPALYSVAQAEQGAALYAERCAMCHGRSLEGTLEVPGLTGKFVANWAGRPVGDLSGYVGRAMPQFAPGSLAPDETGRLVAFILQANGYPGAAGTAAGPAVETTILPPPPRPH